MSAFVTRKAPFRSTSSDVVPVLFLHEREERVLDDARVVDEDVRAAEVGPDAVGQRLDLLGLQDVHDQGGGLPARAGGSPRPSPPRARGPAGRSGRRARRRAASSSEIARPMPREPPVTTAVLIAAADYIHGGPDRRERARRMAARRPIDPAHHPARASRRARPRGSARSPSATSASKVSFQSVGKQKAVPSRRRISSPAGDRPPLRAVVRHVAGRGCVARPAISGAIASATGRISSLWIGQLIVSGSTESARGAQLVERRPRRPRPCRSGRTGSTR